MQPRSPLRLPRTVLPFSFSFSFSLSLLLLLLPIGCQSAPAESPLPPGAGQAVEMVVTASEAWARETGAGFNGALYLQLANDSPIDDQLTGLLFEGAGQTEIHRTVRDGDLMRMEHQAAGVTLPAGGRLSFEPGGYHIMLMDLRQDLVAGETLSMTLELEEAGRIPIEVEVRGLDDL